jgi:hypothetical protein
MTLRGADLRFALSMTVRSASVLADGRGGPAGHRVTQLARGLQAAGVELVTAGAGSASRPVDVVVAPARRAGEALAVPAAAHLLLGRPPAGLRRRAGGQVRTLLVSGDAARPAFVVPADEPVALRYYLGRMSAPTSPARRARNLALATTLRGRVPVGRLLPPRLAVTVVTAGQSRLPLLVRAAEHVGVRPDVDWLLALGTGDDLQRAVFHLLDAGRPRWVLKFARVPGHDAPFRRDEAGLGLAGSAGPVVAARAPVMLGRFEVAGIAASVETAAAGRPLLELLRRGGRPGVPAGLLDSIAGWVVAMGVATAAPPAALAPERARLEREVLPPWRHAGAPVELVRALPELPAVLQHNDLGSWNVVTDGQDFTAVDWESARLVGLPLWDLLYLLADCLVRLDGPAPAEALVARALALFRGESARSPALFAWVRRAVTALHIPPEAVGPIATLCWLHHGLSADVRGAALAGAAPAPTGHLARLAAPWLTDPALGPAWSAWSA